MKVAVSSRGPGLDARIDPIFGHNAYFVIVDSDTFEFESIINDAAKLGGGASIQAARLLANSDAKAVLTGNIGPNASRTLTAAELEVYMGARGTVRIAIQLFEEGKLPKATI
jgi:predicted Fe-Mo cluster-binding NifX family protein